MIDSMAFLSSSINSVKSDAKEQQNVFFGRTHIWDMSRHTVRVWHSSSINSLKSDAKEQQNVFSRRIHIWDMARSYVYHYSFAFHQFGQVRCKRALIRVVKAQSYLGHESFICVSLLIRLESLRRSHMQKSSKDT